MKKHPRKRVKLNHSPRLNLGCGKRRKEGYVNVDLLPTAVLPNLNSS